MTKGMLARTAFAGVAICMVGAAMAWKAPANADVDLSVKLVKISGGRFALGKQGSRDAPLVLEDDA